MSIRFVPIASGVYQPVADRLGDEMGARAGSNLGHRIADVRPDRVVRDAQLRGDLRARVAERDEAHDLALSGRERPLSEARLRRMTEVRTPARRAQRDDEDEAATRDDLGGRAPLNRDLGAAGVDQAHHAGEVSGIHVGLPFALAGERAPGHDLEHGPADHGGARTADERHQGRVGVDDPTALVEEHHRVARLAERAREQLGPSVGATHGVIVGPDRAGAITRFGRCAARSGQPEPAQLAVEVGPGPALAAALGDRVAELEQTGLDDVAPRPPAAALALLEPGGRGRMAAGPVVAAAGGDLVLGPGRAALEPRHHVLEGGLGAAGLEGTPAPDALGPVALDDPPQALGPRQARVYSNVSSTHSPARRPRVRRSSAEGARPAAAPRLFQRPEPPPAGPPAEGQALVRTHAEDRLVVVRAGAVDDLRQHDLAGLGAIALAGIGTTRGVLEGGALPASVLGMGDCEVAIHLLQVRIEAALGRLELAAPCVCPARGEQREHQDDRDDDDLPGRHGPDYIRARGPYCGTARESRCAPTLRFTRWRALSTVLQSQSRCSPMPV